MSSRYTYCVPCAVQHIDSQAVVVVDGDPLCRSCARRAGAPEASAPIDPSATAPVATLRSHNFCSRGCGKPPHRGSCPGQAYPRRTQVASLPAKIPAPTPLQLPASPAPPDATQRSKGMDMLHAEEISVDQIPDPEVGRKPIGRSGELWVRFQALKVGVALKVKCRDSIHAGTTDRDLRAKAAKAGLKMASKRVGADYYCWRAA